MNAKIEYEPVPEQFECEQAADSSELSPEELQTVAGAQVIPGSFLE